MPFKDFVELEGSELTHPLGHRVVGPAPPHQPLEVTVSIRRSLSAGDLDSLVEELASRPVAERRYLTPDEFAANYGAEAADIAEVEKFAEEYGLSVSAIDLGKRAVRLVGTAGNHRKAFDVQLLNYSSPRGQYLGYPGRIKVPKKISHIVNGVFGLDTMPVVIPHVCKLVAAQAASATLYTPLDVASLYNFPAGLYGEGQTVAILEFSGPQPSTLCGYSNSDLQQYFGSLDIAMPDILSVSVAGGYNAPTGNPNSGDGEVCLDIEVLGAIVPQADIVVYFAQNTSSGFLTAIKKATHDRAHRPGVISISWGGPEKTWTPLAMRNIDTAIQEAGVMGVTVCVAAGDNGSTDGLGKEKHVDFPASSPHSLACGGTRLESSGGVISSETVWNDAGIGATGGGVSTFFTTPTYQEDVAVPPSAQAPGGKGRGSPDICGVADPVTGYKGLVVDGQVLNGIGGTSAVAPLWAALVTLINQKLNTRLGWINPRLYQQGEGDAFNDITSGNNGGYLRGNTWVPDKQLGYNAGTGWDPCTGWGSPNGTVLSEVL